MRIQTSSLSRMLLALLAAGAVFVSSCYSRDTIDEESVGNLSGEILQSALEGRVSDVESHLTFGIRTDSYEVYRNIYQDVPLGSGELAVDIASFNVGENARVTLDRDFLGSGMPAIVTGEEGLVSWQIDIPSESLYQLYVEYYPVDGKNSAIEREVLINGEVPFNGARHFMMTRVWVDEGLPTQDNRGNEIRASLAERPRINSVYCADYLGYSSEPFQFYFKEGVNTISFRSVKEPVAITKVVLRQKPEIPAYARIAASYPALDGKGKPVKFQAERTFEKSDQMLYPMSDRSSAASEPFHFSKIRLNTIGGLSWRLPGQWVNWEFEIEEEGLYQLAARARQNLMHGFKANRRILIDGKVPFQEADEFTIEYSTSWNMEVFGGKQEPYLFHLKPGRHVLQMETGLGELGPILQETQNSVYTLNYAYRKLLMLTGANPDIYRDYNIDDELPDVMEIFAEQSVILYDLVDQVEAYTGDRAHAASLERVAYMLERMYINPFLIPRMISELKTNVAGIGTWIRTSQEQPLEIDYITFVPQGDRPPNAGAGPFREVWYSVSSFVASFFEDYDSVGNKYEGDEDDIVTVWMLTGRDQAQILKRMVDDTFTPDTGLPVNVRLVMPEVLLPATVAGIGPDVAMQIWTNMPVDYAIRNAVEDFTQFPDFEEVASRFYPSALVPYTYQDGVYGLPETQEFQIMFYRKDILDELGIPLPNTWDDLYNIMADLQKNHLEFVLPVREQLNNINLYNGSNAYNMLLFQNGGDVYKEDGIATDIDSEVGIRAFEDWTNMYVNYRLPEQYNFISRFRTGEVPIGINTYLQYNALAVFAPEIRGLWGFAPVPGTLRPDGTIDRSVPGSGQASIILKDSKNKEGAWNFVKWWLSADSQERYGKELESVMGPAARHPTANREAMERLAWPAAEFRVLQEQWQWVRGVPEVPGSYFMPRHVDNAWRQVLYNGENPRETLLEYVRKINDEITSKRKEFGLVTIDDLAKGKEQ
ncbi:MAG: extracellular solute-binding protein [Spirochaetales bacterium]|nr:extracellular solute-binding protein [Spirochaetales bacterium]